MTVLLAGMLAGVVPATAIGAGPSRAFFGTQSWNLPDEQDIAVMKRGRVGTLRALFDAALEISPDPAREAPYDA